VLLYKYEHTYPIDDYITAAQDYAPDSPEILRRLLINNDNRLETLQSLLQDIQKQFKRIIIFVDRVDYAEKIHKAIEHSYIMTGAYDNNATKNLLLKLDSYVLVAMTQCVRE
jgi:superfamily II DNA or RNA helicase